MIISISLLVHTLILVLSKTLSLDFYVALIEYADEKDGDMGSYLLSGHLVRLALQQGLHRDPSQHENISVFEAEMRRRIWKSIVQLDLLACVRIGLPKSLRYSESDTREPRNLYDEELYEDMKELPPSRPLTEPTPMSYSISKGRIMTCYGRIVEFLHQLVAQPYEEVLRLDSELMAAREKLPPRLQLRAIEDMRNDPPSLIMERCIIQQFYHKAICLLHRKYWRSSPTDSDGSFFYSLKVSLGSAMALLNLQELMHRASQPGGPLKSMKWYHFAITNHDFLLAPMIVCLDLMNIQINRQNAKHTPKSHSCLVMEIEKLNAVEKSRTIWSEVVNDCKDAKRAVNILDSVLGKLKLKVEESQSSLPSNPQMPLSASNPGADCLKFNPSFTTQYPFGLPMVANPPDLSGTVMRDDTISSWGFLDTLGSDLNMPANFDWVSFMTLHFRLRIANILQDAWDQFVVTHSPPQIEPGIQDLPNEFFQ